MSSSAVVGSVNEIATLLRMGLTPITNNRAALETLGFERAYPETATGYRSRVWERPFTFLVGGQRRICIERAILEVLLDEDSDDSEILCTGETRGEYKAEMAAIGACARWVPASHAKAAARGVRVPCGAPLPCPEHAA